MPQKRTVLEHLTRDELGDIVERYGLQVPDRRVREQLLDAVASSRRATLADILPDYKRDRLKELCRDLGLADDGREKSVLIERLIGAKSADVPAEPTPAKPARATKVKEDNVPPAKPEPPAQAWLSFPEVVSSPPSTDPTSSPPTNSTSPDVSGSSELTLTVDVEPRKPRLTWQGMTRKEVATAVPTQVVEIVRPGRAIDRGELAGLETRTVEERDLSMVPPNRLIWTNDNLVALQTLLDERDSVTHEYRYRGKVDLVYIDPPFMVNNDFRADNSIDIELDGVAGVQAKKEPSLVEILAYKDTWRQGLDSFLSMLRRRLELLKQLLAPTGSIYVHLDWHAVHYVKVLMDEIFGYENFVSEIVWKRTFARSDSRGFNHVHDTILGYGCGPSAYWSPVFGPHSIEYIRSHYSAKDSATGKRFQLTSLESPNPRPNMMYEWKGYPSPSMGWRFSRESMAELDAQGLIHYPERGGRPRFRRFLDDDGMPVQSIWADIAPVNSQSRDRLGYPTQKPVELLSRLILASCPPGGIVLDCFMGSGTTAEAAERLGRRWIGIDNGKYAIHLARKRLIQMHGQPRPPEKSQHDYIECDHCKNIERKEKPQRSPGPFHVRPFTVENMGVYQRAEQWQDFQTQRTRYRDEMIKIFGGEVVAHSQYLHGRKNNSWIHVGPLDGPVSSSQVWSIAREAQRTGTKSVTILSADFDTLSGSEKDEIRTKTGVAVLIRVIPASAIDEVRRRLELQKANPDVPIESMAVPAFYAPLSIVLSAKASGRIAKLTLERCEVDIESFIASQRPVLKPITEGMTDAARKKAQAEIAKWKARERELNKWLEKATSWQKFIDFWSVDWDYGRRVSPEGKPIFETDWQSFRARRGKGEIEPLTFVAEFKYTNPGRYRVAARVTDVFGNDGIATAELEVR